MIRRGFAVLTLNQSVYVVSTEESRHVGRHRLVVVITIVTDVSKLCIEVRNVAYFKNTEESQYCDSAA